MTKVPELRELISLRGKLALITGAAAGIGEAIARRFAEAGADLVLVDIDEPRITQVQTSLHSYAVSVNTHIVNLSRKEETDALWERLTRVPDILVNNAGIYPARDFVDVEPGFYERVMDLNLHAVYWMCQQMIRRRGKKGGVIINVGSIEALLPFKNDLAHYSMSKAGVIALTRALAKEHGRHGFRVNVLIPGGIFTKGTTNVAKNLLHFRLGLLKTALEFKWRLPLGRIGKPDEIARMAVVLASDLASYVQGAMIPVDGGFLAA